MHSSSLFHVTALLSVANAHGVILAAQGIAGSPASVGFKVNPDISRDCIAINPCQQDTTIIRDSEIANNVVNECGRTELTGNIDVGQETETAISSKAVTQVQKGSELTVTIHQVNADGAGPYACDLDQTSNAGVISHSLIVTNNVPGANGLSSAKEQDFNITVTMPTDLSCAGASTGNICTVRCRNNAVAGPFGGCFPVQQNDVSPTVNNANTITTNTTAPSVAAQVQVDQAGLSTAKEAIEQSGPTEAEQGVAVVNALLEITDDSAASPAAAAPQAGATGAGAGGFGNNTGNAGGAGAGKGAHGGADAGGKHGKGGFEGGRGFAANNKRSLKRSGRTPAL